MRFVVIVEDHSKAKYKEDVHLKYFYYLKSGSLSKSFNFDSFGEIVDHHYDFSQLPCAYCEGSIQFNATLGEQPNVYN